MKKLIEELETIRDIGIVNHKKDIETITAAINALKQYDYEAWHPIMCDDYPTDDRPVLLSFENFSVPLVGRYEDGSFYVGDDSEPCSEVDVFVNAWSYLKEQYKGDS